MICPHCESEIEEHATVCGVCNKPLGEETETVQTPGAYKRKTPVWLWIFGVIILITAFVGVFFLAPGFIQSPEKPLLFTVISNNPQGMAIFSTDPTLKNPQQIVLNDSGLMLPFCGYYGNEKSFLSPDRQNIAMATGSEMTRMTLFSVKERSKTILSEIAIPPYGLPVQGFSSKGKFFGFTTLESDDPKASVQIFDKKGKAVREIPDAIFGGFSPDERQIVVLRYDPSEVTVTGLDIVEIASGKRKPLVDMDYGGDMEASLFTHPFFSPDGKDIFFVNYDQLFRFSITGGEPDKVYTFKGGSGLAFISPKQDKLVLVDMQDDSASTAVRKAVLADILFYDLKTKAVSPLAERIIYNMASKDLPIICEQAFLISDDQKQIAHNGLSEETGQLVISAIDGSRKDAFTEALEFSLEFTPDNRALVYLARPTPFGADILYGDLYISNLDGKSPIFLDKDVWSFTMINGGKEILYIKVDLPTSQTFTSEIYKINADGTGKVVMMESKDGIYTFLKD